MRHAMILAWALAAAAAAQQPTIADFKFSVRTLGGQQLDQDDFKDNVLIVDLWGTWCPPCREAVGKLVGLYGKYKHQGLEIVGFHYAGDGSAEDAETVRKFAVENHITYALAPGEPKVRDQVPGFSGYPTLLLFQRGLKNEAIQVGYSADEGDKLEQWVVKALGGDSKAAPAAEPDPEAEEARRIKEEKVPNGKIFMPGNGDQGLDFEATDAGGDKIRFRDLHGKPVLLVLTATWNEQAATTTEFLQRLVGEQPKLQLVAVYLEQERDPGKKAAAVREYRDRHRIGYPMIPAGVKFAMDNVHRFAAFPTLLLFDATGALVLRENGISPAIEQRVREGVAKLLAP